MSADADFYFIGIRRGLTESDKRLDGYFVIPQIGFYCRACSGSSSLYPTPAGRYSASNFRKRTDAAMVRDGLGFSVDLSDKWHTALERTRSLLRIHHDGNLPGTQGCVGIISNVKECHDFLQEMLPDGVTRTLEVVVALIPEDMMLCTSHGCFIFA